MRIPSRVALTAAVLAGALSGCTTDINLDQREYPCTPGSDDQCPGGWHCGINGLCHAPDAGAYPCNTNADCEGWTCSRVDHVCHSGDAGAYACIDDTDCAGGWRCGLNGVCLDASGDRLDADAGSRGFATAAIVQPAQLQPPREWAAGRGTFQNVAMQTVTWLDDAGMHQAQRFDKNVTIANQDVRARVVDLPDDGPMTAITTFGSRVLWATPTTGVWSFDPNLDAGAGVQVSPSQPLANPATMTTLRAQPAAHQVVAFNSNLYALIDVSKPVSVAQVINADNVSQVAPLYVGDAGPTEPIIDLAFSQLMALAATPDGLLRAVPSADGGFLDAQGRYQNSPFWAPVQPPGIPNALCASPDGGERLQVVRLLPSQDHQEIGAELRPMDGGSMPWAALFQAGSGGPDGCPASNGGLSVRLVCPACPTDQGPVALTALTVGTSDDNQGNPHPDLESRCRFAAADGGQFERAFRVDTQNQVCVVKNPNENGATNLASDLATPSLATPAAGALWGAEGEIWFGVNAGFGQLDPWLLDRAPQGLVDIPDGTGNADLNAFTTDGLWEQTAGLGLVANHDLASSGLEAVAAVDGKPGWVVFNSGMVIDAMQAQGNQGPPPPLAQVIPSAVPLDAPVHAALAPLFGGGSELLVSTNDSLLAGDVSDQIAPASGNPPVDLVLRLAPLPRVQILSFVAVPPQPAAADGGVQNLLEGYVLTSNTLFHFSATSQQRWNAEPLDAPEGEWLELWADGTRGRLGYADGTVYSLPNRVKLAAGDELAGDVVQDYQQACGGVYALGLKKLYTLVPDPNGPLGHWSAVAVDSTVARLFERQQPGGRLFWDGSALYAFSSTGLGAKFTCR